MSLSTTSKWFLNTFRDGDSTIIKHLKSIYIVYVQVTRYRCLCICKAYIIFFYIYFYVHTTINVIVACIRSRMGSRTQGSGFPSTLGTGETASQVQCSVLDSSLQEYWVAWVSTIKLVKELENKTHKEWLRKLGLLSSGDEKVEGRTSLLSTTAWKEVAERRISVSFFRSQMKGWETASSCTRGGLGWILGSTERLVKHWKGMLTILGGI